MQRQTLQQLQVLLTTVVTGFLQNWQVIETGLVPNVCPDITFITLGYV